MKIVFNPECDEIHFTCTRRAVEMHLDNQSGDTFVVELDEAAAEYAIWELIKYSWCLEHDFVPPKPKQKEIPF